MGNDSRRRIALLLLAALLVPAAGALAGVVACCLADGSEVAMTGDCHSTSGVRLECCTEHSDAQPTESALLPIRRSASADDAGALARKPPAPESTPRTAHLLWASGSAAFHPDVGRHVLHSSYLL